MKKQRIIYEKDVKAMPLELTPVIESILAYGRKTHSIGMIKACQTLKSTASELKRISSDLGNEEIQSRLRTVIMSLERESKRFSELFVKTYENE